VKVSKAGAVMQVSPEMLDFGLNETEKTMTIENVGVGTLAYTTATDRTYLLITSNPTGTVTADNPTTVGIRIVREGLSYGQYDGNVTIAQTNAGTKTVPVSFTILAPTAPTVTSENATDITHNSVSITSSIVAVGSAVVTEYGHCLNTTGSPTISDTKTNRGGTTTPVPINSTFTNLEPSTPYYIRAYATNSVGTAYSTQIEFTTLALPAVPTVITTTPTGVQYNQLTATGEIIALGDNLITDYGFCYSASNFMPTIADTKAVSGNGQTTQLGAYTATVTGLQAETKYYIRAYATNSVGTAYGTVVETITLDAPPLVTTGLIAYYTFNGSNGNEEQGHTEYNGTKSGTCIFADDRPDTKGKSLQLDSNVYYSVTGNPIAVIGAGDYTINVWVKTNKSPQTLFRYADVENTYKPAVAFSTNNAVVNVCAEIRGNVSYEKKFNTDVASTLMNNQWHMLTITRYSGTCTLYIDNVQITTVSGSTSAAGNYAWRLGEGFTGMMDNFRFYNRVITPSEITTIYNAKQ
jgi:hypothetical protein